MKLSRLFRSFAACFLAVLLLCSTAAASGASSASVVATALGEVGSVEGADEHTKYGEWYGYPNGYWCDMFVSWCAMRSGVPASQFPRQASCTEHVKRFVKLGLYQDSAARGGSYVPRQGDVIFFYKYAQEPEGKNKNHTGLVLYVEDSYVYTIEGNALANRLDLSPALITELRDGDLEPPDYVTVNRYPLDAPHIHGYGVPAYDDRTPLTLNGFVDLGRHSEKTAMFQSLCDAGLMRPTSSHTFSPNHGMTRADFVAMAVDFFGLLGYDPAAVPFDDVSMERSDYTAIMTARAAGLIGGVAGNAFLPDRYISPRDAQTILNRALAYVGLEEREFSFSRGDFSYIVSPYTIRADIAAAFDGLCQTLPMPEIYSGFVLLNGEVQNWPVRNLNGIPCVSLEALRQAFPELELPEEDGTEDTAPEENAEATVAPWEDPLVQPTGDEDETESGENLRPVPMGNTDRALPAAVTLRNGTASLDVLGFTSRGTLYVSLAEAAALLSLDMEQSQEGPGAILLTVR